MGQKIWNLKYVAGNPAMFTRVTSCADNPMTRAHALLAAEVVSKNGGGWRVWVERIDTLERIFESAAERFHLTHKNHATAGVETQGQRMAKNWGVARFFGMGSIQYLLESGAWLADRDLFDGAPILLFESMADADAHAATLPQDRQPHGVKFMLDDQGKVQTVSQKKESRK
ncbi:hypothetical protein [Hydrogenophaga defluvii]|uniref:Uncharacterized protein n=1 Tax=Hydrogenophaga defluvii TaxID=249410 RepID=A0ABW2SFN5_9BURK